ncbi:MAG TPA: PAS domain S-box protein [Dongiaceae bacterium]|nr:PAS domain S-box protein [Dongiaceae bacterium]
MTGSDVMQAEEGTNTESAEGETGCGGLCTACARGGAEAALPCLSDHASPALRDHFLRAVLMNMSEAVVAIDARGIILFFSPGSERLLGYGSQETVGRNVSMLMAGEDAIHHDRYVHDYLHHDRPRIIGRTRQVTAVAKTGERIAVDLRVVPLNLGGMRLFVGSMRDVRERVRREARLAAARRQSAERNVQLRDVLRSVSEGICLFDSDLRLIAVNQRFRDLFHMPYDKVRRGASFHWLIARQTNISGIHSPDPAAYRAQLTELAERRAGGTIKVELAGRTVVRIVLTPLPDGRLVITATDVTDEEMVAEQLRRALAAERAASKAKSDFLASMNHELRTPLNAILGMADAILQGYCGDLSAKQQEYLRDIHVAGQHLRDLIGDILDLSKIESGHFKLLFDRHPPDELVRECARIALPLARQAGLRLESDVAAGLGDLNIDLRIMKQAILNLLSNAIKFTPSGGLVSLRLRPGALGGARIEVIDTGIGMTTSEVATAMSVFGQVENVMSRSHSGTGLGLPLARAFVELHGGSLRIDSAPRRGTHVIIELPPACVT